MSFIPTPVSELGADREVQKAESILATGRQPTEEMIRSQFKLIAYANHPDHGGCGTGTYTMEKLQWAKKTLLNYVEKKNV